MDNSKLIAVLQTLDKSEWRNFKKFVASPLYNRRKDVIALVDYLYKNIATSSKKRTKAAVFKAIFPKQTYQEATINYTMSYTYQLLKKFLTWQETQLDLGAQQFYLTRALRKKGVSKSFEEELQRGFQLINNQPFRSYDYYYKHFQLQQEKYSATVDNVRKGGEDFQDLSNTLTYSFIIHQLRQSCFEQTNKTVKPLEYKQDLQQAILELVGEKDYSHFPAIQVYFYCYKMLTENDAMPYFTTLKALVQQHQKQFPIGELKDIYLLKINFCVKKINTGQHQFFKEVFELYQEGLELGIFFENGYLSRFTYKNINSIAILLNEFEWAKNFLNSYKEKITPTYRASAFYFNMAILHYKLKNYDETLQLLQQTHFDDVLDNCNARRIMLRTYYELGAIMPLLSLLDNFKNYLYRHKKDIGYHQESYSNLVKFTQKLISNQYDKAAQEALRTTIENTPFVADRAWLLEQLKNIQL